MIIKKLGKKIGVLLLVASTFASSSICSAGEADFKFKLVREEDTDVASIKVYKPNEEMQLTSVQTSGVCVDDNGVIYCPFTADNRKTVGVAVIDEEQNLSIKTRDINIKQIAKKMKKRKSEINISVYDSKFNRIYLDSGIWNKKQSHIYINKNGKIKGRIYQNCDGFKTYANKGKSKRYKLDNTAICTIRAKGNKKIYIVEEYDKYKKMYIDSKQVFSLKTGKRLSSKVVEKRTIKYPVIRDGGKYYYIINDFGIFKYSLKNGECVWKTDKVASYADNTPRSTTRECVYNGKLYFQNCNGLYTVDESANDTEAKLLVSADMFPEVREDMDLIRNIAVVDNHIVIHMYYDEYFTGIGCFISIKMK